MQIRYVVVSSISNRLWREARKHSVYSFHGFEFAMEHILALLFRRDFQEE